MGRIVLLILIGLSEGLVVGTAIVAFLILLDIVPRLAELTGTQNKCRWFEYSIILGAVFGALGDFLDIQVNSPRIMVIFIGIFMGMFVGLLAAALTEVLNVLPIISKRLGLQKKISVLLTAIILGKILGSLIYWLVPGLW
ncbi:MAG: stage V sporulation protein AB [Firmicutes bacterium HGW-Firmicutes-13]|nr:MAG: stage V sporulation protein AB [Firmicutes bacterium HGW-Firmicutes-13]